MARRQEKLPQNVLEREGAGRRNRRREAGAMKNPDRRENDRQKRERRRGNAQIMMLTYVVALVFLGMIGYFSYFMVTQSQKIINNPYNKRQEVLAKKIVRGEIRSSDGKVLAKTETDRNGNETRVYPYGKTFCHVVGRNTNSMTGIERNYCYPLLTSHVNPLEQLVNTFRGEKSPGDNIITTLDAELQEVAYQALGEHKGAVVAIDPSTGKVLAMVSKPAYDPNRVQEDWDKLVKDSGDDSKLINRASQGLYPPGSTFKILTAMEYMMENPDSYDEFHYQCKGSDSFSGNVINCYGKERHGKLNLQSAFARSCNGAFAKIGTMVDLKKFQNLCEKFGFNKSIPVEFEYNKSKFSMTEKSDMGEITQTAMGQGKTMITPLENAMITATIANGGEMMTPYLIDRIESDDGKNVANYTPKSQGRIVEEWVAKRMNRLMKSVVNEGTGSQLKSLSVQVAGKTGSAEFDSEGTSHAWFVGYAPADNPRIAISIVVEGAGTGSQYAVPIAKKMFQSYLE